jgi:hypothetical protein
MLDFCYCKEFLENNKLLSQIKFIFFIKKFKLQGSAILSLVLILLEDLLGPQFAGF